MKVVCCKCHKEIEQTHSEPSSENIISHGFCEPCAEQFIYEELGKPLQDFLDSLEAPVLLIEPGPRVRTANRLACDLIGKSIREVQRHKGGEVIECVYSKTPDGCGSDVHCQSCTIRNTVLKTFETGISFDKVKAYPDIYIDEEIKSVCLEISTEKVGEMVLLRIDDLRPKE